MPKVRKYADVSLLALSVKREPPPLKLALGLDLGTSCGLSYCWFNPEAPLDPTGYPIVMGQLDLSLGRWDSPAVQPARLRQMLRGLDPDVCFFENTRHTPPDTGFPSVAAVLARAATAIEFFAALKSVITAWGTERNIPVVGIEIADIKRRATSKGNASKADVIAACNEQFGTKFGTEDYEQTGADDVADSVWCLVVGLEMIGRGLSGDPEAPPKKRVVR
ncbi:MAG TPA: hypothetical protein VN719_06890 [Gemmatimonadales bacterium]|nr:hypothetical protein [Gemmatimonadales bacterium]